MQAGKGSTSRNDKKCRQIQNQFMNGKGAPEDIGRFAKQVSHPVAWL
jgi:hypothetical protein